MRLLRNLLEKKNGFGITASRRKLTSRRLSHVIDGIHVAWATKRTTPLKMGDKK
jgi:hypothetical protein